MKLCTVRPELESCGSTIRWILVSSAATAFEISTAHMLFHVLKFDGCARVSGKRWLLNSHLETECCVFDPAIKESDRVCGGCEDPELNKKARHRAPHDPNQLRKL